MDRRLRRLLRLLAATLSLAAAPVFAQHVHEHEEGVHVDADATFKLGVDRNYRSSNARSVLTDGYGEVEGVAKIFFNSEFSVQTKLHWERVKFPTESRAFGGHGLYMENLFANWESGAWRAAAGKFNPNFGMGWDDARLPGFYANEFAKDYQMKEAIGGTGAYKLDAGDFGNHRLDASLFFFDNTALSQSVFNNPAYGPGQGPLPTTQRLGRNRLDYGGPGNTNGPRSLAFQYELADPAGIAGLTFGAGYRYLRRGGSQPAGVQAASGPVASRDSQGVVAGARYEIGLPFDVVFVPFVEWARFTNVFNADPQIGVNQFKDRTYLTAAATFAWRDFTLVGSRMTRTFGRPDAEATSGAFYNQQDRQVAANLLYKVVDNLTLGVGWKRTLAVPVAGNTNGQALTRSVGAQAVYTVEF
jgi:hypothetical protein